VIPNDSRLKNLEAEVVELKTKLQNLELRTQNDIAEFRRNSIDTLATLPDKIANAEQTILNKQSVILSVAGFAFTLFAFFAGLIINNLVNQTFARVSEIQKLNTDATQLIENLQRNPNLAYERLNLEDLKASLNQLRKRPNFIAPYYDRFLVAKKLPPETFDFFLEQATDKNNILTESSRSSYIKLFVVRFIDKILLNGDFDQINIIKKVNILLYDDDYFASMIIQKMKLAIENPQVRNILINNR
jgi:hypothetical protein